MHFAAKSWAMQGRMIPRVFCFFHSQSSKVPTDYPRPAILPLDGGQAFKSVERCQGFSQKQSHNLWTPGFYLHQFTSKSLRKKSKSDTASEQHAFFLLESFILCIDTEKCCLVRCLLIQSFSLGASHFDTEDHYI